MTFPLSVSQAEYETLIEFARQGTLDAEGQVLPDRARALQSFLVALEEKNDVHRYFVWVQWQEQNAPLPPSTVFPEKWPPELRSFLALVTRPIARSDVDALLKKKAKNPTNVLVTKDPGATVGWTALDEFFK